MLIVLTPPVPSSASEHREYQASKWKKRKRSFSTPPRIRARGTKRLVQKKDETEGSDIKEEGDGKNSSMVQRSTSECYFVVKGAAIVLPHDECMHVYRKNRSSGAADIQQHLQSMFYLLQPADTLKMAVKLESVHVGRVRYLVVVSCFGDQNTEESCLLGIDCGTKTTVGLVLPVWADTQITLDGDGGFSVSSTGRHHIFKPVSVQAMWSALQTLHKASAKARKHNYYMGGGTHQWIEYYEKRVESDRSCLNEWHAMDDLVSRRPLSPDTLRSEPTERDKTEQLIRTKLKELMMSVDLDEVTSKYIRIRLEEELDMNLNEYKSFIDQEMLTILGQMDAPTEIFEYLYLGSEWNASNLEELKYNGVGHILNVTREIDNFFPGMFDYSNIRVYDDETTEMLHYWDKTYKYIAKVKNKGSKVLVHCKMGISRSASVVIAYVMKAYDWNLDKALEFVKNKRNCIKPNSGFLKQLEIYQGILDASKQRHNSLWRSKSETNLKSPEKPKKSKRKDDKKPGDIKKDDCTFLVIPGTTIRPKSWSPDDATADLLFSVQTPCREFNTDKRNNKRKERHGRRHGTDPACYDQVEVKTDMTSNADEDIMQSSKSDTDVSDTTLITENGVVTLNVNSKIHRVSSIKDRINKLESQVHVVPDTPKTPKSEPPNKSGLVLNLASQFEYGGSKPGTPSPVDEGLVMKYIDSSIEQDIQGVDPVISQMKPPTAKHHAILIKPNPWSAEISEKSNAFLDLINHISDVDNDQQNKDVLKGSNIPVALTVQSTYPVALNTDNNHPINLLQKSSSSPVCTLTESDSCVEISPQEITMQVSSSPSSHFIKETLLKQTCPVIKDDSISENNLSDSESFIHIVEASVTPVKSNQKEISHIATQCSVLQDNVTNKTMQRNSFETSIEASQPAVTTDNNCLPTNEIYDKEAIPWTPGTVLRTKQHLEEQNIKNAFDTNFPAFSQSTPSTPPEVHAETDEPFKCVQRSNSLRSEQRPSSMYVSKYYPLPALAAPRPFKTPRERLCSSLTDSDYRTEIVHSVSSPSVVEAVNDVICGTQEILTSAIQSLPLESHSPPTSVADTKLQSHIGILLSNPKPSDIYSTNQKTEKVVCDNPFPGTVKQQKEFLENLQIKPTPSKDTDEYKTSKEQMRLIKEYGKSLVSEIPASETEEKDFGMVKRLTKELEAKSGSVSQKKDRIVIINRDGEEIDSVLQSCICEHTLQSVRSTPSSPTAECRSKQCTLNSDQTAQSKLILTNKQKCIIDNVSDTTQGIEERVQQPPPAPHRKTSLDLDCLKNTLTSQPSQLSNQILSSCARPLSETLANIQNLPKLPRSLSSNGLQKSVIQVSQQLTQTTSSENVSNLKDVNPSAKPPLSSKGVSVFSTLSASITPPPPGPPRKMRKQQGKSHPLTKLTVKQRHTNPLYNTM